MPAKYQPCPNCPWRVTTKTADIPGGGMQGITLEQLDASLTAMGCHQNADRPPRPCSGFMVQVGFASVAVRIAATFGRAHPDDHDAGGAELYDTNEAMLEAHRVGVR